MKIIQNQSQSEKFITFTVADYCLALPIKAVLKVLTCPVGDDHKLSKMGLIQVGRHIIRVLDLHQYLGREDVHQLPKKQAFLLITPISQAELYGILIYEPPDLIELPLEMMQPLSQSHYQSSLLDIFSHAIVVSQEKATKTIFLLDLQQVFKCCQLME
ncbi:MAG: chemotaxis protein CheW [Pelatocladus maniniholoensis HA4357-MV3]|jgi:chemotaxis signal transduction protein|uniref:Chemotaxis protein CheW n=1 Tax=Pelatocladus maniniholoensis HA4357-MV3 TaxID=1117104 RepID=A0A9E3H897_9NOST|nr:chemotaxis protein CheW [Pelatocladus maniniholoensis HA4357-MV3]BAZ70517.1 CheW protein [Fischerella sp. NIES-4106]